MAGPLKSGPVCDNKNFPFYLFLFNNVNGGFRMIKTETLKKNYEFRRVLTKGNYLSGKYIECFYIKSKTIDKNFIGIAISSKIAKAVNRNKIKRLIRENYGIIEKNIKTGNCFVFLWKKNKDISNATFINIKNDMDKIMKEMNVYINE